MPIELRGRLLPENRRATHDTSTQANQAFYYGASPISLSVDPEYLVRTARDYEAAGLDSALIAQRSSWPDVWARASWALASTERLRIVSAHRIGLQTPTSAARALATIDRLSGGRANLHVILGSTDADQRRDGDFVAKADRYRRAAEYVEILIRQLGATEPFDYAGEFYQVENALPSVRPVQHPRPVLSFASSAEIGQDLAARFFDTYALSAEPLAETRKIVAHVRDRAHHYGRTIRFWRDANFVLADTEAAAHDKARLYQQELLRAVDPARASSLFSPESIGGQRARQISDRTDWHDRALYTGLTKVSGSGPAFVGTPATAAAAVLDYYELGIETFSIGITTETEEDRELRAELLRLLREGAAERDRVHNQKEDA
ncbi:LLM class flavin-dependent oxidoreductase [Celeribacter indicus]|uniref:Alkanesulfonate monooxygenase n=1 Tax=Celeribacter indicus TaxID=1208324 RepID=A0A0B5DYB3_9RHOB|nr:LLM class flavin-dependent oxidoreductase [Celeribacter indicus]AJE46150.1 Alkanesulfonate monooxygenase [Celeribacter indicus]SDX36799.1 alkanesulfonate monooxygenase [Celeribacter indicus]